MLYVFSPKKKKKKKRLFYHVCVHIIKKVNAILDVFKFSIPNYWILKKKCY